LRKLGKKESIILVPGGAAESLHAHPGIFKLHLRRRQGFVRLALETGASPIPCLGFGENEAFDTLYFAEVEKAGSSLWQAQQRLQKLLTVAMPVITWPVPNRRPIHVVVGEPVRFTSDNVERCHEQYVGALQKLYDDNKGKYGYHDVPLQIV
jgi:Diacylglycerol acyltransferase